MALHGEVMVNGGQLSRWWAQRDPNAKPSDGWITYTCGWIQGGHEEHFTVRHHYDDGYCARRALMWLGLAVLAPLLWPALLAPVLVRGLWWLIRTAYPKEPR